MQTSGNRGRGQEAASLNQVSRVRAPEEGEEGEGVGEEAVGGGSREGCTRCPGARLGWLSGNVGAGCKLSSENAEGPLGLTWEAG